MSRVTLGFLAILAMIIAVVAAPAELDGHTVRVRLALVSGVTKRPGQRAARVARLAVLALQEHAPVLALVRELYPPRPRLRSECENGVRPCPFVSCRYHLGIGYSRATGQVRLHYGPSMIDGEIPANVETCALDVAEDGRQSQEKVAHFLSCTVERIRQIEREAEKNARAKGGEELFELLAQWAESGSTQSTHESQLAEHIDCEGETRGNGSRANRYRRQRDPAELEAEELAREDAFGEHVLSLISAGIPLQQAIAAAHAVENADDDTDEDDQDDEAGGARLELLAVDEDLSEPVVSWFARRDTPKETQTHMATTTNGVPAAETQKPASTKKRTDRTELRAKVLELLRVSPRSVASLAEQLGEDVERVRALCKRLRVDGEVHTQGGGTSSTWAIEPAAPPAKTEDRPRRAARRAPAKKHAKRKMVRASAKKGHAGLAPAAPTVDAALALELLRAPEERVQLVRAVLSMLGAGR